MADLLPTHPYYPSHPPPAHQTQSVCEVVRQQGATIDALRKVVDEQGVAIKALEKTVHAQAPAEKLRQLAIANDKTGSELADHARAITAHTGAINRQAIAIEGLQYDGAVLTAAIVGTMCIVFGRMMLSALFKRKSANPQTTNPSPDDIIRALLQSTRDRS
jgi:hypothetical protein